MSMDIQSLINSAAAQDDQSQTKVAGERKVPAEGLTVGRLIEYVELGVQPGGSYNGKPKPPVEKVRLVFELLNPNRDIHDFDGRKFADKLYVIATKSLSSKARFKKLFNALDAGRGRTHMAQFLGEAFVVRVFNIQGQNGMFATLFDNDGNFEIRLPYNVDPMTGQATPIDVPPALSPLGLFLWNNPTPETWAALYVEGEWEDKDDKGNVLSKRSKNKVQEMILAAKNFAGSPLEAMLMGMGDMTLQAKAAQQAAAAAPVAAPQAASAPAPVPVAPMQQPGFQAPKSMDPMPPVTGAPQAAQPQVQVAPTAQAAPTPQQQALDALTKAGL